MDKYIISLNLPEKTKDKILAKLSKYSVDITERKCNKCLITLPIEDFAICKKPTKVCKRAYVCKSCVNKKAREMYHDNRESRRIKYKQRYQDRKAGITKPKRKKVEESKNYDRGYYLKKAFGITEKDFDNMMNSQNNSCAICKKGLSSTKEAHIDHCHKTGAVRGILCRKCNAGLGQFSDDINLMEIAINYLLLGKGNNLLKEVNLILNSL